MEVETDAISLNIPEPLDRFDNVIRSEQQQLFYKNLTLYQEEI